jgi:hypothetical protein
VKFLKGLIGFILIAAFIPMMIYACDSGDSENVAQEQEKTAVERFVEEYDVPVAFAESLEIALSNTRYGINRVYSFKRVEDWAEGERYSMWMDMEYVWYAYCKGDEVVGIRDSRSNSVYQAD